MDFDVKEVVAIAVLSLLLGANVAWGITTTVWRHEAIEYGAGRYHPTSGQFEWIEKPE